MSDNDEKQEALSPEEQAKAREDAIKNYEEESKVLDSMIAYEDKLATLAEIRARKAKAKADEAVIMFQMKMATDPGNYEEPDPNAEEQTEEEPEKKSERKLATT